MFFIFWPFAFVPVIVRVSILPSLDTTRLAVLTTLPDFFRVASVGSAATSVAANPKRANTSFVCRIVFSFCADYTAAEVRCGKRENIQVLWICTATSRPVYQRLI